MRLRTYRGHDAWWGWKGLKGHSRACVTESRGLPQPPCRALGCNKSWLRRNQSWSHRNHRRRFHYGRRRNDTSGCETGQGPERDR